MLNENIIKIDFDKINKALAECDEPVVMVCNLETASGIAAYADEINEIEVQEEDFDRIITYAGTPIIINTYLPFGHMIIK